MENALMNFIADNQTYVISYEVDKYLEDMGFDFRLNPVRCTREYFKTIYCNDRVIKMTVDSEKRIYVSEFGGLAWYEGKRCNVMVGDLADKEITVEFLDSEEFILALREKMKEALSLS